MEQLSFSRTLQLLAKCILGVLGPRWSILSCPARASTSARSCLGGSRLAPRSQFGWDRPLCTVQRRRISMEWWFRRLASRRGCTSLPTWSSSFAAHRSLLCCRGVGDELRLLRTNQRGMGLSNIHLDQGSFEWTQNKQHLQQYPKTTMEISGKWYSPAKSHKRSRQADSISPRTSSLEHECGYTTGCNFLTNTHPGKTQAPQSRRALFCHR